MGLVLTILTGATATAQDAEPQASVKVGVLAYWPPYYLQDPDGNPDGFAVDTVKEVCRIAKVRPDFKIYRYYPQLIEALDKHEIDVVANLGVLMSRHALFTVPVSTFSVALFVRRSSVNIASIDDVPGDIGVVRQNIGTELVGNHPTHYYDDVGSAIFGLLAGQVDGIIYPKPVVERLLDDAGLEGQFRAVTPALQEVTRAIAVRPDLPGLYSRLNNATRAFIDTPTYRETYLKWQRPPASIWTKDNIVRVGLALLALVATILVAWRFYSVSRLNRELLRQSQLLEVIDGALIACGTDRRINYVNEGAERMTGWPRSQLLGSDPFTDWISGSSQQAGIGAFEQLMAGEPWTGEIVITPSDNQPLPLMVTASPLINESGTIEGFAAFATDLSGFKLLESQLLQAQRMEAMGKLAGGIAHDFNNILTIIQGEAELAREQVGGNSHIAYNLDQIIHAANSAATITRRLLAFGRQQSLQARVVDPAQTITGLTEMLRRLLREDVSLSVTSEDGVWPILVDEGQLEQVILNLVINSNDALARGGAIQIDIRNIVDSTEPNYPAERVEITVNDNGHGMDQAVVDRVFEPFFTTKPMEQGTGLGLSIVHGIVNQSGGKISISSQPGEGTTVTLQFPRTSKLPQPETEGTSKQQSATLIYSILVVEDELAVRRLIRRILERDGYTVQDAGTPSEALAIIEAALAAGTPPDLLITDFVMPEMTGAELSSEVANMIPGIKVLYLTGYTDGTVDLSRSDRRMLTKPFSSAGLTSLVEEFLAQ